MQNILEYEIVLANGTIANIKASESPDLVRAMRGGGDQFGMCGWPTWWNTFLTQILGIVTKYTLKAYPIGKVKPARVRRDIQFADYVGLGRSTSLHRQP